MPFHMPQPDLIDELVAQAESGLLPQSLILHGPEGIGKTEAACRAALEILGHAPAHDCNNPRGLAHPDLLLVRPDDTLKTRPISIESVRAALGHLRMKAARGGRRFLIIDEAERMGPAAQDALLKSFEEPPAGANIVLTTSRLSSLRATLRSRSRTRRVAAPDNAMAIVRSLIPGLDADRAELLVELAGGSPGKALSYDAADAVEIALEIDRILGLIAKSGKLDRAAAHALAARLGADGFPLFAELVDRSFHLLTLWAAGIDLDSGKRWPGAASLAAKADRPRLSRLAKASRDIEEATETQALDKFYAVVRVLIAFERLVA